MPTAQSNSKATKKRMELVSAIDTLNSHLQTTFVALSSALYDMMHIAGCEGAAPERTPYDAIARAHMMFVVGPSIGAARAKVAFVVDGLEVKSWSERQDAWPQGEPLDNNQAWRTSASGDSTGDKSDEESDDEDSENSEDEELADDGFVAREPCSPARWGESIYRDETPGCEDEPPPSRSPSPSPSTSTVSSCARSRPTTPIEHIGPQEVAPLCTTETRLNNAKPMPPPMRSHAEEQGVLRSADRLLSRTLATACAEDDGGLSSELRESCGAITIPALQLTPFYSCFSDTHLVASSPPIPAPFMDPSSKPDAHLGEYIINFPRRSHARTKRGWSFLRKEEARPCWPEN